MRDILKIAAQSPYFPLTMSTGINNLLAAAKLLSSIGIDVNGPLAEALRSINDQLTDAAYETTDLSELLEQAQSIGDEIVPPQQEKSQSQQPPGTTDYDG